MKVVECVPGSCLSLDCFYAVPAVVFASQYARAIGITSETQSLDQRLKDRGPDFFSGLSLECLYAVPAVVFALQYARAIGITSETPPLMGPQNLMYLTLHLPRLCGCGGY